MYDRRIKIFVVLGSVLLAVFLFRLAQLQLKTDTQISEKIADLRRQQGRSRQLKTLRGKILDRNGKILATDQPVFDLYISCRLAGLLDQRFNKAGILLAERTLDPQKETQKTIRKIQGDSEILQQVIEKSARFGAVRSELEDEIRIKNDQIWNIRLFQAWRKNCPQSPLYKQYKDNLLAVKSADYIADFENNFPDTNDRLVKIGKTDIVEMHQDLPIVQLKTDDDVIAAQIEFMNIPDVKIMPRSQRAYPFGSVAAQTIGWVSTPRQEDIQLFEDDRYSKYVSGDVSGRDDGVEYVCETLLRGKRGELYYDPDGNEVRLETQFGKDVRLTLDIQLQEKIEKYMTSYSLPPDAGPGLSVVIIDVSTGQILVLASLPTFDLNRVRFDYSRLINDAGRPLSNRAINELYPPGSSVKPVILIAGLEAGAITPQETMDCLPRRPPQGWPQCWIFKQHGQSHGSVNARNAIKGSCNIYFSHLADRINSAVLQKWLFNFGYGRRILRGPAGANSESQRNFNQAGGIISSSRPTKNIQNIDQLPPLVDDEKRYFGIGQGNLRATPLQVANAMSAIARGGYFLAPTLFIDDINDIKNKPSTAAGRAEPVFLGVSPSVLDTVYDGMHAVVNEPEGTAYNAFSRHRFSSRGITVYGKTGSCEAPEHAWFAGFAKDNSGHSIAVAVLVEGGKSGSNVAAPLAADILSLCVDAGYPGKNSR